MASKDKTPQQEQYAQRVETLTPKRPLAPQLLKAFWVGGLICIIGQCFREIGQRLMGLDAEMTGAFVAIVMVFLGTTLTGLGVYDKIGEFAGAGSIIPITGFANSVAAPAMEFKREGLVMGVGAKMFVVAGPVLVYGIGASILAGLISLLFH